MMESLALLPPCGKPTRLRYRKGRVEKALVLCHQYYPPLPLPGTLGDLPQVHLGAFLEGKPLRAWPPDCGPQQLLRVPTSSVFLPVGLQSLPWWESLSCLQLSEFLSLQVSGWPFGRQPPFSNGSKESRWFCLCSSFLF